MGKQNHSAVFVRLLLSTLLFARVVSLAGDVGSASQQDEAAKDGSAEKQKQLKRMERRFYSGDEAERLQVKNTLIGLGAESLPTLHALLAWKAQHLTQPEETDIQEILRSIPPDKAVPYFIEVIEKSEVDSLVEGITSEMKALILIGRPAVPYLIKSMQTIRQRGEALNFAENVTREEREGTIQSETIKVLRRAAVVLGEIGDARAIEPLKKLLEPPNDPFTIECIRGYVEYAIDKIEK